MNVLIIGGGDIGLSSLVVSAMANHSISVGNKISKVLKSEVFEIHPNEVVAPISVFGGLSPLELLQSKDMAKLWKKQQKKNHWKGSYCG